MSQLVRLVIEFNTKSDGVNNDDHQDSYFKSLGLNHSFQRLLDTITRFSAEVFVAEVKPFLALLLAFNLFALMVLHDHVLDFLTEHVILIDEHSVSVEVLPVNKLRGSNQV